MQAKKRFGRIPTEIIHREDRHDPPPLFKRKKRKTINAIENACGLSRLAVLGKRENVYASALCRLAMQSNLKEMP
jgi:hypothetical protein